MPQVRTLAASPWTATPCTSTSRSRRRASPLGRARSRTQMARNSQRQCAWFAPCRIPILRWTRLQRLVQACGLLGIPGCSCLTRAQRLLAHVGGGLYLQVVGRRPSGERNPMKTTTCRRQALKTQTMMTRRAQRRIATTRARRRRRWMMTILTKTVQRHTRRVLRRKLAGVSAKHLGLRTLCTALALGLVDPLAAGSQSNQASPRPEESRVSR
mmetsp:Transcript_1173/g.2029  ORF Transcript_1173/g.2029 Transcript_1173/m.2029 type:complete len:213 (-) Transcript_1173:1670-2308(-)